MGEQELVDIKDDAEDDVPPALIPVAQLEVSDEESEEATSSDEEAEGSNVTKK